MMKHLCGTSTTLRVKWSDRKGTRLYLYKNGLLIKPIVLFSEHLRDCNHELTTINTSWCALNKAYDKASFVYSTMSVIAALEFWIRHEGMSHFPFFVYVMICEVVRKFSFHKWNHKSTVSRWLNVCLISFNVWTYQKQDSKRQT